MSDFIDIHSHILQGIDDGSKSLEQSMNMIRIAYHEGIRQIIATPHFYMGKYEKSTEEVRESYIALKKKIEKELPCMKLYLGNEIMYTNDIIDIIDSKRVFSLADSRYVLVEFRPSVQYETLTEAIRNIQMAGKIPIFAHIERYETIMEDIYCVDEIRELGACVQVNAVSVSGKADRKIRKKIKLLMKEDLIDFVATDSHSDGQRAPYIKACAEYIRKKFDAEYMRKLLVDNPQKLIDNEYL